MVTIMWRVLGTPASPERPYQPWLVRKKASFLGFEQPSALPSLICNRSGLGVVALACFQLGGFAPNLILRSKQTAQEEIKYPKEIKENKREAVSPSCVQEDG